MKNKENWYNLGLGEVYIEGYDCMIKRVPGGWVYSTSDQMVFIPFNNEFLR
jgi:hypothetical protein